MNASIFTLIRVWFKGGVEVSTSYSSEIQVAAFDSLVLSKISSSGSVQCFYLSSLIVYQCETVFKLVSFS